MNRQFLEGSSIATISATPRGCSLAVPAVTEQTAHRPWPLPQTPWLMFMRWHDLIFLHWPIRPEVMRPFVPPELELDTFDGWSWIAVVPFHMSGVRPRYFPVPLALPELNVRTYVKTPARSGVWFFSLDADSWIAVRVARWLGLPYYDARMKVERQGDLVHYESVRSHRNATAADFGASYWPTGPTYHAAPGTLDHWLTERYCLFGALSPNEVVYGEIHHPPWSLQPAEAELRRNTMIQSLGIGSINEKPIAHFARLQEVVAWPIAALERSMNA